MTVELRDSLFDPWQEIQQFQNNHRKLTGKVGATSVFVGTMRDFNDGKNVSAMTLEHYPEMTQKHLQDIALEAAEKWQLIDTLIIHRYGDIKPDQTIVLLAVWAEHRADSISACRYLIEELKTRAPFWKKETTENNTRWVEKNSPA